VGFPLTSGPVAFILALDHGASFAAGAALGTLAGTTSQVLFCLGYSWAARNSHWPIALAAGSLGFAAATAVLEALPLPMALLLLVALGTLLAALHLLPNRREAGPVGPAPRWDLPVRMSIATLLVLSLTGFAPALGPRLTGLLSPYPLYAAILAAFAHQQRGPAAATQVLRGLLFGLFAFAGFFAALAVLLERVGIGPAFLAAIVLTLALQAVTLTMLRRSGRAAEAAEVAGAAVPRRG
jgi:hypothetical protein